MVKIHLIRTGRSTRASRALLLEGPPHPERMVKRPPIGIDSSRGMVAYGPAAGTSRMRPQHWLTRVVSWRHWIWLPFGWTLVVEGKRRDHQIHVWEE